MVNSKWIIRLGNCHEPPLSQQNNWSLALTPKVHQPSIGDSIGKWWLPVVHEDKNTGVNNYRLLTQKFKIIRKSAKDAVVTFGWFGGSSTLSFRNSTLVFTTLCLVTEALCPGYPPHHPRWIHDLRWPTRCTLLWD